MVSSDRSLEDEVIAEILLFQDSDNDFIPSDSASSKSKVVYIPKRKQVILGSFAEMPYPI